MADMTPFFVGDGGERLSFDQLKKRRDVAAAMLKGNDKPIKHWTEGAANVAEAIVGGLMMRKLDNEEKAAQASVNADASALFGGGSAAAPAAASAVPEAPTPTGAAPASFSEVAPRLKADLAKDFSLTDTQAAAFTGNLAHESGGFKTLQEVNPVVPGSRGGFGYAQWTGPRRRAFETWAAQNQLDPTSYEANYGFLKHELANTSEGKVLDALRQTSDPAEATRIVSDQFLRPGIPGMPSRQKWTQRALTAANEADLPAPDAMPAEAPIGQDGFVVPPAPATAMTAQNFNAISEGQPLDPAFVAEGVAQPWMGTAIPAEAPQQVAQNVPLPPVRPADLPAPGAVEAIGQMPAPAPQPQPQPQMLPDLSNSPDGGMRQLQMLSEQQRQGQQPAPEGAAPPAIPASSPLSRVVAAFTGGGQATPAAAPSPAVARVAQAAASPASPAASAPASAATDRVAAAMRVLNSPYAQPGQRAVAQMVVQQAFKDPTETEMKRLQLDKARREADGAPLETEGRKLDVEAKRKSLNKVEPPTVQRIKQPDGSEVAVQWDQASGAWVPLAAPQGGNAVTGSPGNPYALPGKPTESQSKDAGFASRMVESHNLINGLESQGTNRLEALKSGVPGVGNSLITADRQRFEQAKRNFITAILRKESGAAIAQSEFDEAEKNYFPVPGDSPENVRQKREAREIAIEGVMAGAGSGYKVPDSYKPSRGQAVDTSKPGNFRFNPATGKMEPM